VIEDRLLANILDRNFQQVVRGNGIERINMRLDSFLESGKLGFRRRRILKRVFPD
jgi:hypothetical protein